MRRLNRRHPINCVVPSYIWTNVAARSGRPERRERAVRALSVDTSFRQARLGSAETLRPLRSLRRLRRLAAVPWEAALAALAERTVYDAQNGRRLPGVVRREEGDPETRDPAVDEAYDGLGATRDLYFEEYGRNSIDGEGMDLVATVHYGREYNNAFWDGRQMVFGDGDGDLFNRFTIAIDVIGHELTHGVTEHEAGLIYWGQAGALNESVSDVFGSLIKQFHANETAADADWLIGEGLLADGVNGIALRSMKAPGTAYDDPDLGEDPQPAHMRDYVRTLEDNGGVHINSGIPNHAFYLTAMELGGYAWEVAGHIWYETLASPALRRAAQFQRFATLTVTVAQQLYGPSGREQRAVRNGWAGVGITV